MFVFLGEILGEILSGSCARKIVLLRSSMDLVSSYVFEWSLEVEDGLFMTRCVVALSKSYRGAETRVVPEAW